MKRPWEEERRFSPILIGGLADDDPMRILWESRQPAPDDRPAFLEALLQSVRYVVFGQDDQDGEFFEFVFYAVDLRSSEMVLSRGLRLFGFDDDDDAKRHLVRVLLEEIPVFAENDADQARLDSLIRDLLASGYKTELDGKAVRLALTSKGRAINVEDPRVEAIGEARRMPSLSETRLAISALREELNAHQAAARTLAALRLAIGELESALAGEVLELALQAVLTRHPVLFGPEYVRVVPQHELGSEFVMDFALQRAGGWFELIEIERSTHRLFKKDGAPTAALVHAEQQILDWLEWTERHGLYARERLPGLTRPQGWVVIGRSGDLSEADRRRLVQRNALFASAIHILTWDQLLERGKHLLAVLDGSPV